MQLFELKSISRRGCKLSDGSYEVYEQELGIFDSVENAETFMKLVIDKEKKYSQFHCFVIIEKTMNRGLSKKWDNVCEFEGIRSYLPDGTFYCDSPYDDACEKPFRGRPAETIKLKAGELAWYWAGGRIIPCIVAAPPMTDVYYQERVKKCGEELGLDYTDDAYTVFPCDNGGHEHPECWRCVPYYGKLSKRNLQRIQANKRREEAMCEAWRKSQEQRKEAEDVCASFGQENKQDQYK